MLNLHRTLADGPGRFYLPHRTGIVGLMLDGDPKQMAERQMLGLEEDIGRAQGTSAGAVASQLGVATGSLRQDRAQVDVLKQNLAGAKVKGPGMGMDLSLGGGPKPPDFG